MEIYLAEGKAEVDFATQTLTFEDGTSRALTSDEVIAFSALNQQYVVEETVDEELLAALTVLRSVVSDQAVSDAELNAAVPLVLGALLKFANDSQATPERVKSAVQVVSRIVEAILYLLLQSKASSGAAIGSLSAQINSLKDRVDDLEMKLINNGTIEP